MGAAKIAALMGHYPDPATMDLCRKALTLSPVAQIQFISVFNADFAKRGQVFLESGPNRSPHLFAEAPAAGIEIVVPPIVRTDDRRVTAR
jgi:hypothetical protein